MSIKRIKITSLLDSDSSSDSDSDYVPEEDEENDEEKIIQENDEEKIVQENKGPNLNILNNSTIHLSLDFSGGQDEDDCCDDDDDNDYTNIFSNGKEALDFINEYNKKKGKIIDKEPEIKNTFKFNKGTITDLQSLIDLLNCKNVSNNQKDLVSSLQELNNLIGIKELKMNITDQIVTILSGLVPYDTLMNTVITGSPGTGKSTIINILSKVYKGLGYLETDKVIVANRSNLIGRYLGETTQKTSNILNSAKGGILLIDEVYAIYTAKDSSDDQYGRECLNIINQFLTENPRFICIVAGYHKDVEEHFFAQNSGLRRRFPWVFNVEDYNSSDLADVFFVQTSKEKNYIIEPDKLFMIELFKKYEHILKNNGGDTRELFDKSKIFYAKRALGTGLINFTRKRKFSTAFENKHIIIKEDIENAIKLMNDMKSSKKTLCNYCTEIESQIKSTIKCTKCTINTNSMYS